MKEDHRCKFSFVEDSRRYNKQEDSRWDQGLSFKHPKHFYQIFSQQKEHRNQSGRLEVGLRLKFTLKVSPNTHKIYSKIFSQQREHRLSIHEKSQKASSWAEIRGSSLFVSVF